MPRSLFAEKLRAIWLPLAIVAATFALYFKGAGGPFLLDDFPNIVFNLPLQISELSFSSLWNAAFSSGAGPLKRPVAMLSLALNCYFDGLDPYHFKIVNIAIHLATTALLFLLTERLLTRLNRAHPAHAISSHLGAALITALWALHPLHVSTVLYSVQRMTGLATLFTVAGVLFYVRGRELMLAGQTTGGLARIIFGLAGCGVLAILSKESGALLPVYVLVTEAVFFRFKTDKGSIAAKSVFAILLLSTATIVAYLVHVWLAPPPPARAFTQSERLLTEARIVLDYLGQILLPRVNDMSLFDSGTEISRGFWSPPVTLPAILALCCMLAGSLYAAWKNIWLPLAFAIGWFFTGHLLESTSIPLELRFEHRNYLASYGILFGVGYAMMSAGLARRLRPALHVVLIATLLIGLAGQLHERVEQWSTPRHFYRFELTQHPDSARAWVSLGFSEEWLGHYASAVKWYAKAAEIEPMEVGHLIAMLNITLTELGSVPPPDLAAQITRKLEIYPLTSYGETQLILLIQANIQKAQNDTSRFELIAPIMSAATKNQRWTSASAHAVCFYLLADLAIGRREFEPAILALRDGLALEPNGIKRLMLVKLLLDVNKTASAQAEFEKIERVNLDSALLKHYNTLRERLAVQPK